MKKILDARWDIRKEYVEARGLQDLERKEKKSVAEVQ